MHTELSHRKTDNIREMQLGFEDYMIGSLDWISAYDCIQSVGIDPSIYASAYFIPQALLHGLS